MREPNIEIDCHIVLKKLEANIIVVKHVALRHQLSYLLTKSLGETRVDLLYDKLNMYDIYNYILQLEGDC